VQTVRWQWHLPAWEAEADVRCVWRYLPAHGRPKSECKECGGSGICAHGRIKRPGPVPMNDLHE
jgi:hypothetical protein